MQDLFFTFTNSKQVLSSVFSLHTMLHLKTKIKNLCYNFLKH